MSPGTFSPSCPTWLPRPLTLSLLLFTLLFSSQFLFFFLVKTPRFVLKFLRAPALGAPGLTSAFSFCGCPHRPQTWFLAPADSLAPCPLHTYFRGPISDQGLPSHHLAGSSFPECPLILALFIGQGLFCLFPSRGQTEDKGRKGGIWSCGPCNAGCTESLITSNSLRIFVPEDTGVTLTSWLGTR